MVLHVENSVLLFDARMLSVQNHDVFDVIVRCAICLMIRWNMMHKY